MGSPRKSEIMDAQIRIFLPLFMLLLVSTACAELSPTFYDESCPNLEDVVRQSMNEIVEKNHTIAASIVRLSFHDCFVNGCDASVLLIDTPTFIGEQNEKANDNLRGMKEINTMKEKVEAVCSDTVSCADILALAARDAVVLAGGPHWNVLLGRRDALTASQAAVDVNIPSPDQSLAELTSAFSAKGLSQRDLVALSGAHTIGVVRFGKNTEEPFDPSPGVFDNAYYRVLVEQRGLLSSDQELFPDGTNTSTKSVILSYASNQSLFFNDFAAAMVSMGSISPLTGTAGEIRRNCSLVN